MHLYLTVRDMYSYTHAFKRTHTYKVPPAASGQLNHALIKPWSEFELEHYPLTVINAAALLGGQSGQWGRDEYRTYRCWHLSFKRKIVYITFMVEVCIIWITAWTLLLLLVGNWKNTYPVWKKKAKSNSLKDTLLSNQSEKWCEPRYCNPAALDAWWDITKLLLKSEPWGDKQMEILIFTFFQYT